MKQLYHGLARCAGPCLLFLSVFFPFKGDFRVWVILVRCQCSIVVESFVKSIQLLIYVRHNKIDSLWIDTSNVTKNQNKSRFFCKIT